MVPLAAGWCLLRCAAAAPVAGASNLRRRRRMVNGLEHHRWRGFLVIASGARRRASGGAVGTEGSDVGEAEAVVFGAGVVGRPEALGVDPGGDAGFVDPLDQDLDGGAEAGRVVAELGGEV